MERPPRPGPTMVPIFPTSPFATFPAGSKWSGKRLGTIAEPAGAPNESPRPIRNTKRPIAQSGISFAETTRRTKQIAARKESAPIMIHFRGNRSAQTPPINMKRVPANTREARIKPSADASPPLSRTVTASAMGNAYAPRTKISPEIKKLR